MVSNVNVVLIGAVGAGKSTFGNFLCNLGLENDSDIHPKLAKKVRARLQTGVLFKAGSSGAAVTKLTRLRTFQTSIPEFKTKLVVNIIDTPGLMEGKEADTQNMLELHKFLRGMPIHAVFYCASWSERLGEEQIKALIYYQKLFAPVFASNNAVLIGTKLDNENYEAIQETVGLLERTVETRLREVNAHLDATLGLFTLCHFVQSFRAQKALKKFLNNILLLKRHGAESDNVAYHSYLVRELLFAWLAQSQPASMGDHLFPLPPILNDEKQNHIKRLDARVEQLRETVQVENKASETYLHGVDLTFKSLSQKRREFLAREVMIKSLAGPQRTSVHNACGNDILCFRNADPHDFYCPIAHFELKTKRFHAEYSSEEKPSDGGKIVTVVVKPNFFNLSKQDNHRWFCSVHLEYDGEEHHRERLLQERTAQTIDEGEIKILEQKLADVKQRGDENQRTLTRHLNNLLEIEQQRTVLSKELFRLEELPMVFEILGEGQKPKPEPAPEPEGVLEALEEDEGEEEEGEEEEEEGEEKKEGEIPTRDK